MARINFDDDIESKKEFWKLLPLVGNDRDVALGKLVRFFRLAQRAYGEDRPIDKVELEDESLIVMIDSGWAIPFEGGYRGKGCDDHFAWYRQRVDAGKKRAESERDEMGRFKPSGKPAESSETPAEPQLAPAAHQPLALAPALVNKEYIYSEEFESIWKKYGSGSKQVAAERFKKYITASKLENFKQAVDNYLAECAALSRYLKDLSTFIGTGKGKSVHYWLEYVNKKPTVSFSGSPAPPPDPPCDRCEKGLIRVVNRSSRISEHVRCVCVVGRRRQGNYACWDENRFEKSP